MTRPYSFARRGSARLLAGASLAAALAGCGATAARSGAGSSPATPGPAATGSQSAGVPATGALPAAGGGSLAAGAPPPAPVNSRLIHQSAAPKLSQANSTLGRQQAPTVSQGQPVAVGRTPTATHRHESTDNETSEGPAATDDPSAKPRSAPAAPSTQNAVTSTTPSAAVRTVVSVRTIVRDVVVRVPMRPRGPLTAFLPSTHPALGQTRFVVAGGNVGCSLYDGGLLCTVKRRVWAGPVQPQSCRSGWGDSIVLSRKGAARFLCGRASAIATGAKVIPDGWDDRLGGFTCQVRSVGVDCFSASDHGLMISRTGYATY